MFKLVFISIVILKIIFVLCTEEQCTIDNKSSCNGRQENIYLPEENDKFFKLKNKIYKALEVYEPCESKNCSCYSSVISKDLKVFKSGITKEMLDSVRTKGTKYQIIDGRLYRDKDCLFPSRCVGVEHFLLKLIPKLPNMELIINTRDYPQIYNNFGALGPVFSFSKTDNYGDIMYPTWAFWEGGPAISLYPRGLGRWDQHRTSVSKAGDTFTWEKKLNKGFFRGSRTNSERDTLVLLSREHPELVDAQYTKNQAWKSDADTLNAAPAEEVSLENHCQYKYLFNFRGVAASFRFKHLFLCKSLVFHVGDDWLEFFYPLLKPWVHYIPVETTSSKTALEDVIAFARENDEIVQEIAERGYDVIWDHLKMQDVICYWNTLLRRYKKLFKYEPVLDTNLIEIRYKY